MNYLDPDDYQAHYCGRPSSYLEDKETLASSSREEVPVCPSRDSISRSPLPEPIQPRPEIPAEVENSELSERYKTLYAFLQHGSEYTNKEIQCKTGWDYYRTRSAINDFNKKSGPARSMLGYIKSRDLTQREADEKGTQLRPHGTQIQTYHFVPKEPAPRKFRDTSSDNRPKVKLLSDF